MFLVTVLKKVSWLGFILLLAPLFFGSSALAGENFFNSRPLAKEELVRLKGEGEKMVKSPVTEFLPATLATLGVFGVTYIYDREIRSDLAANRSDALHRAADVGAFVGNPYLQLGGAAIVYTTGALADSPRLQRIGEELGEALILADLSGFVLKSAVGRGRPRTGTDRGNFRPFSFKSEYDSLPSMHTASSFAVAHVLASETESVPAKLLYYTAAGFVGFSRLYQEEHWASDIILGAALGELAGRAVTSFRAGEKGSVRLVPAVSQQGAAVALQGTF
ncbi:phosphatase PAP2 family protein [Geomonas sp. RF6]|uniref:phosphatase PAP2 family protein n=1 Tax=Geomonas sp. RF6 TaxID=2897342 RepID=UPI001E466B4E|nr:phosphatase PAP2 family protein [Geomonas sp. RF6]UFS69271.1 phosphatase PAP2 family protein [Geomonas sp. RF6]